MARRWILLILFSLMFTTSSVSFAAEKFVKGGFTENVVTGANAKQSYTLYLPSNYDTEHRWPLLLIFDPRQRGTFAAEIFREAAEKYGWILVSSNQTRSDGEAQPSLDALNALWPEVHERFAVDPRRIYAAGFSGGGILAMVLGNSVKLAGVIDNSGRPYEGQEFKGARFAHFGVAGNHDFNYLEMRELDDRYAAIGTPHRFEQFEGSHRWMSKELAAEGVEWMELLAMRDETRPKDEAFVRTIVERERKRAVELEQKNQWLAASRQYRWMVETLGPLVDVSAERARLTALSKDERLLRERETEKRWFRYEKEMLYLLPQTLDGMKRGETAIPLGRLRSGLRIAELKTRAAKGSYEGEAAQRVLESFFTQTSFYLYRDAIAAGNQQQAVTLLSIANELQPRNANVLYNLACALARTGERNEALEMLRQAIDAGFADRALMSSDEDLASLRDQQRFKSLLEMLPR
jgi:tetratricopeptide (TPR) repeat protein